MEQLLSRLKPLLSWGWKRLPERFVWRSLWFVAPKFNVGVGGIVINEQGEVLLLRHVFRPQDEWAFPAGWVEHGESIEAALHREVMEETGVHVEVGDLIQLNSRFRLRIEAYLHATTTATTVSRVSAELFDARFFPLDALPPTVQPSHRRMLERLFPPEENQPNRDQSDRHP